jgi:hypothetical protein
MNAAVLGTGMVGRCIASRLAALGHDVRMGSRTSSSVDARWWADTAGSRGSVGTFADAAAFGEVVFNCTLGAASLDVLNAAGAGNLSDKILIDVANVLPPGEPGPVSLFTVSQRQRCGGEENRPRHRRVLWLDWRYHDRPRHGSVSATLVVVVEDARDSGLQSADRPVAP